MFVLLTSISQYISEIVLFSEYEILTGRLVTTKLLDFRLLWDVTVYVIDRQNCPTASGPEASHTALVRLGVVECGVCVVFVSVLVAAEGGGQ